MARGSISKKATKKVVPVISRRSNAAKLLESKKVGFETEDWSAFGDQEQCRAEIHETLMHLNYFYDKKGAKTWAVAYAKKRLPKLASKVSRAPDWKIGITIGSMCRMALNGCPWSEENVQRIEKTLLQAAKSAVEDTEENKVISISPAERLKEKTSDFIAEIEETLDMFNKPVDVDWKEYSVYNELLRITAAAQTAKEVEKYYRPMLEEIQELVSKKTPDLVEAYSHLTLKQRKELLSILKGIVEDAVRYQASKKATRATRKPKVKSIDQQVSKLKYAKESAEFKVTSVSPEKIVGAEKVLLFDVKTKTLTVLRTSKSSGMSVKGSTIIGFDSCEKKKLRKPGETLSAFLKSTKASCETVFKKLTTKASEGNGRVNDRTIILKVYQ